MKNKIGLVVLILVMGLLLAACGSQGRTDQAKKSSFPTKSIELIIPFPAGGGTDLGARVLKPYLEKELGVTVNIVNKPGAEGWVGWAELANAKPDGYTIGYVNSPTLVVHTLDPNKKRKEKLSSYTMLANHVTDANVIVIRKNETRFTDVKSLLEYAKTHELTTGANGVGSDDHIAILKINQAYGTKLRPIQFKGAPESQAALMGGHIDILVANVSEFVETHRTGELKVIIIMAEKRSEIYPEVPTMSEIGPAKIINASSRAIGGPAGLDPQVQEILGKALEKAINNPEHKEKLAKMGLVADYRAGADYTNLLKALEQDVLSMKDALGWK